MTSPQQFNPFDLIVATNLATKIDSMLKEMALLADSFGTSLTLQQVLTGVLNAGLDGTDRALTREEFMGVYDYVMARRAELAQRTTPEPEPTPAPGVGDGPEATAHADSAEEADRLADHWGDRISDVVFTFEVPDLGEPDCG